MKNYSNNTHDDHCTSFSYSYILIYRQTHLLTYFLPNELPASQRNQVCSPKGWHKCMNTRKEKKLMAWLCSFH